MRLSSFLSAFAALALASGAAGCRKNTFEANAPEHEALFGGAYGEGHDPYGFYGAYMLQRDADVLIVFGGPYPVLAFAWLDAPVVGSQYAAIDFSLGGEAGWLDDEAGWENANGNWSPDIDAWFDLDAVKHDAAVLSAGRITVTDDGKADSEGYPTFKVEGNLVWGNPASAGAAWYSWEGKDVWSLRDIPKDL